MTAKWTRALATAKAWAATARHSKSELEACVAAMETELQNMTGDVTGDTTAAVDTTVAVVAVAEAEAAEAAVADVAEAEVAVPLWLTA